MKFSRRVLVTAGVLAALWLVAFFILLPALIRDAYEGQSIPWLNAAIQGQSEHPLEFYESLAQRAALLATVGAVLFLGGAVAAWRSRSRIVAAGHRLVRGVPTVGAADVIILGTWFGFFSGLAEVTSLLLRFAVVSDPREAPSIHALWMGPLSAACMGAFVGVLLAIALRAWRGVTIALPVVFFSSFTIYSIVVGLRLGIHKYAVMVLSLGAAIQLGRLATRKGTAFADMCRRSLPWLGAAAVAGVFVISAFGVVRERLADRSRGTASAGAPNVLFLILDTVRSQDLSLYGYGRETAPEIERLAATGVTFDRAIAPAPWTLPSHASMFTGLSPDLLSTDFDTPLDASAPTIAEVLRARGYATGGFVANSVFATRATGLDRGFSTYQDHSLSAGLFLSSSRWMRRAATAILPVFGVHGSLDHKSAEKVNREFLSWMPTDGKPFFAFLNYFDAHLPYKLEPPYDRKFRNPPPRYWRFKGWGRGYDEADLEEVHDAYVSSIAYVDAQVGALLRELERRGVMRNTVVIVASDHGEHFGEHGGIMDHANSLYLPLLHVPLVIAFPSQVPAGARVQSPVSTQDIPATILDLLGHSGEPVLPGRSLAHQWNQDPADDDTAAVIFSDLTPNTFAHPSDPIRKGPMQSLIRGGIHYIRNGDGSEELYDYLADGEERTNLAGGPDSASLLRPFRQVLDQRRSAAGSRGQLTDVRRK
jgi:arylsulfatase A-like enzyme